MKNYPSSGFRPGAVITVLLSLALTLSMTACFGTPQVDTPDETESHEVVTLPPLTIPDPTDDRTFTDPTAYAERLDTLFADSAPIPASELTYQITEKDEVTVTGYTGGEIILVIPDTIEDKPVTAIGVGAFAGMGNLKAVSIPDSVTSIGVGAFKDCHSLSSLRTPVYTCADAPYFGALFGAASYETNGSFVPVSLTTLDLTQGETIPDYAFYACRGLEVVSLPETLNGIGNFAFYGCESLAYIPADGTALTTVGERAFAGCHTLLSLTLPSTVQTMGMGMLEGCGKLESLTLPFVGGCTYDYPLTEEEKEALEKGDAIHPAEATGYLGYLFGASAHTFTAGYLPVSLMTVTVLEGCESIPANAFFGCVSIREIRLPEGVIQIGRRAFYGCERLTEMTLPDSVTAVGDDAFNGCSRMKTFTGGAGLSELGVQTFMNCVSLVAVTLPDAVESLPNSCFSGCLSLETLTAEGVTSQGKQVFRHCDKLQGWSN
ncbi:MAG: leucine-rich repeat domain-containing protein [Clostridia bacterium]|nr:leucine-rich repeat domain-containing protein [Clostridia bacterium]